MRIHSVTLRNYRIHGELTARLDDRRTLIGGANETGKSTLVEAMHCALFLRARGTTEAHRRMQSNTSPGTPEVELQLSFADARYHLIKRFGNGGSTMLSMEGGAVWHGDEAESRLADLLKVESPVGRRINAEQLARQWAHLWVWQGHNGHAPASYFNDCKDTLLARLQQSGGAAVLQSELDAQVARQFAELCEATFTRNDKARADSSLGKAEAAAQQAAAACAAAQDLMTKLEVATNSYRDAEKRLLRVGRDEQQLLEQQTTVDKQCRELARLREQERVQQAAAGPAAEKYQQLEKGDGDIAGVRRDIATCEEALDPGRTHTERLRESAQDAVQEAERADRDYDAAIQSAGSVAQGSDLLAAVVSHLEKEAPLQQLTEKVKQAKKLEGERAELVLQVAKLAAIDAVAIAKLSGLKAAAESAQAALDAMATAIDVLAADDTVLVGGAPLGAGESLVLVEETEIAVGSTLKLRIRPGGGTSLAQARALANDARQALADELARLTVASLSEANQICEQRSGLQKAIEAIGSQLKGLYAEKLPAALEKAQAEAASAQEEVARRSGSLPDFALPAELEDARRQLEDQREKLQSAQAQSDLLKQERDAALAAQKTAAASVVAALESVHAEESKLDQLKGRQELLVQQFGDDEARARNLAQALAERDETARQRDATGVAIAAMQPELLEDDRGRLERSLEENKRLRHEADMMKAGAVAILRSDGSLDPAGVLESATEANRQAQEHLAGVRRKAEGGALLHQLFQEQQRALSHRYTQPLADKITEYLQCLFGPQAVATVALDDAYNLEGIRLVRPGTGGTIDFDALSGGAGEQVAAAVRLAMAEILALDHDGCLPLVFDDAFAYSDPDRVLTLQRMLNRAASQNLQLIVLTCNPSDYAGLGAVEVPLRQSAAMPAAGLASASPPTVSALASAPSRAAESELDSAPRAASSTPRPPPVPGSEQDEQLLSCVQAHGGSAGNQRLREELGWDAATYDTIKGNLIASGRLVAGRGRGGSVALAEG